MWMRCPKTRVAIAISGSRIAAIRVIPRWMLAMQISAPVPVKIVLEPYMMAGPQILRTASRSLVARAMMSPVVLF